MSQPRTRPTPTPLSLLSGGLVLVLLLAAILRFSLVVYQLPAAFPSVVGLCLLGGVVSTVIWALPRHRMWAVLLVLVAMGVFVVYNQAILLYGARATWAALSDFWDQYTVFSSSYVLADPLPDPQHWGAVQLFLGVVLVLLALPLGWAILRLRAFWLTFVLTLPWLLPAFLAEVQLDWPSMLVICAGWACLLLSNLAARDNPSGGARLTLVVLPVSLVLMGVVLTLFPFQNYTQPAWAAYLREELNHLALLPGEEVEGEGDAEGPHTTSAPEDTTVSNPFFFSSAGPRNYLGRSILRVTTSQPGPLYLRETIHQNYTELAWTALRTVSTDTLPPYDGDVPPATATITRLDSPSSVACMPYQTVQVEESQTDSDSSVSFPTAQQQYTVGYIPLEGEPSPQAITSFDPEQDDAYQNYLDVPVEISGQLLAWFTQAMEELEQSGDPIEATATGVYAGELNTASIIAQLLERNAQYDLLTPHTPSGKDFVTYFLQESHQGYCVHFATAATLLLRTQGIPARYVSGYTVDVPSTSYVTAGVDSVYATVVMDYNAHAWVEIYLNGYGWYPVEVTPTAAANLPQAPTSSAAPVATPTPTVPPATPTATPTPTPEVTAQGPEWGDILAPLVWLTPILALGAALGLVRYVRRRRWKQILHQPDTNAAVLRAYRWFGQLERWGGTTGEEAEALARKARFSQHTLTPEERKLALGQFQAEVSRLRQASPWWKRFLLALLFPVGNKHRL